MAGEPAIDQGRRAMCEQQAGAARVRKTLLNSVAGAAALLSAATLTAGAAAAAPITLAIFDFELEDASAGPSSTGAADAVQLTKVTDEVRALLAGSGRYSPVDVGAVEAAAAKAHALRDCDGCEAAIARSLGAEESLVGVVRRISRTEYTVRVRVRDTRTGAVVLDADSGLRMGADYSWSRGAVRLISDHLLERAAPRP
jgi:Protein of unknown function (DUF2380)